MKSKMTQACGFEFVLQYFQNIYMTSVAN